MSDAPERIWACVEPDWEDGDGHPLVGGKFEDFDITGAGVPYIRADIHEAALAEIASLRAQLEYRDHEI